MTVTYKYPGTYQDADGTLRMASMEFPRDVVYEVMGDSLIIFTRTNGILSLDKRNIKALADELAEIAETWEDVTT